MRSRGSLLEGLCQNVRTRGISARVWYAQEQYWVYEMAPGFASLPANAFMQPIHEPMPPILPPSQYDAWLDPRRRDPQSVEGALRGLINAAEMTVDESRLLL